jgi:hypothetical protein
MIYFYIRLLVLSRITLLCHLFRVWFGSMRSLGCIPILGICAMLIDGKDAIKKVEPRRDFPWFFGLGLSGIVINHSLIAVGMKFPTKTSVLMCALNHRFALYLVIRCVTFIGQ